MLGLILHWLVLELFVELKHTHVACWCNNTMAVTWVSKLLATKAVRAAHLLQTLVLQMASCQASPLTTMHIAGESNEMADFASCSFQNICQQWNFSPNFTLNFCYCRTLFGLNSTFQKS